MEKCLELAGIKMSPSPFFGMISASQLSPALWTSPKCARFMIDPHIHTPSTGLELHVIHMPGVVNAKNLRIEIDVSVRRAAPPQPQLEPLDRDR